MEIPFQDGAEGACSNTVTHKAFLVDHESWEKQRPYMLMIHVDQWSIIRKDWMKGCRLVMKDGGKCNIALESVDSAIKALDGAIETVMKGMK